MFERTIRVGIGIGLFLVLVGLLSTEAQVLPPLKIGLINVQQVFNEYEGTTQAVEQFQQRYQENQDQLNALQREFEAGNISEEQFEEVRQRLEAELDLVDQQMTAEIIREIDRVIKEFGREEGYDLIIRTEGVLYAREGLNITDQIIVRLNAELHQRTSYTIYSSIDISTRELKRTQRVIIVPKGLARKDLRGIIDEVVDKQQDFDQILIFDEVRDGEMLPRSEFAHYVGQVAYVSPKGEANGQGLSQIDEQIDRIQIDWNELYFN
ncbi:MAG: OmpH family outer membrane protein [Candidatus Bipolaricaulia bacterium]